MLTPFDNRDPNVTSDAQRDGNANNSAAAAPSGSSSDECPPPPPFSDNETPVTPEGGIMSPASRSGNLDTGPSVDLEIADPRQQDHNATTKKSHRKHSSHKIGRDRKCDSICITTDTDEKPISNGSSPKGWKRPFQRFHRRTEADARAAKRRVKHGYRSASSHLAWLSHGAHSEITNFPQKSSKYLLSSAKYYCKNFAALRKELLSGLTVSILQVPESVAFSYVANVPPVVGLYATAFMGLFTSLFGGKGGMISGAAGAMAVVAVNLTSDSGVLSDLEHSIRLEHLFMTMILVGVFQMAFGFLTLARFVKIVPSTAMIGFMNGLAIVIFMAQLTAFQNCPEEDFSVCSLDTSKFVWMSLTDLQTWMVLTIVFLSMFITWGFGKIPVIGKLIPASLVGLIAGTGFEHGINRTIIGAPVRTVGETAEVSAGFPDPHWPRLGDDQRWGPMIQTALTLTAVGLFESVMTLQAVNEILKQRTPTFKANQECVAQGIGNLVSGFFGSMGGDAMIGQSTINVMNGARGRLSGAFAALCMFVIILFAAPVIELVPVACLTGVLFLVVIHTFYWPTFRLLFKVHFTDAIAIIGVTVLAVTTDLALAVLAGIAWSALVSVWQNSKMLRCEEEWIECPEHKDGHQNHRSRSHKTRPKDSPPAESNEAGPLPEKRTLALTEAPLSPETPETTDKVLTKVYHFKGPLFFGSASSFHGHFDPENDPTRIVMDFTESMLCDYSAVSAIREMTKRYKVHGTKVTIRGLHRAGKQAKRARRIVKGVRFVEGTKLDKQADGEKVDKAVQDEQSMAYMDDDATMGMLNGPAPIPFPVPSAMTAPGPALSRTRSHSHDGLPGEVPDDKHRHILPLHRGHIHRARSEHRAGHERRSSHLHRPSHPVQDLEMFQAGAQDAWRQRHATDPNVEGVLIRELTRDGSVRILSEDESDGDDLSPSASGTGSTSNTTSHVRSRSNSPLLHRNGSASNARRGQNGAATSPIGEIDENGE